MTILGVDVSKATLDVALYDDGAYTLRTFDNSKDGLRRLFKWLKKAQAQDSKIVLEATGRYGKLLAQTAHDRDYAVYVVNPARIKAYAKSQLKRIQTDAVDAKVIAHFGATQTMTQWAPPTLSQAELQEMTRRIQALKEARTQEKNRLKAGETSKVVRRSLKRHITFLEQQIADLEAEVGKHINRDPSMKAQVDLLTSIPGVGTATATNFIAEVPDVTRFHSAAQLAAFAGLTPTFKRSGSSVNSRARLSKMGNRRLRGLLYMPAIVAKRFNPLLQPWAKQLAANGKHKRVIISAVMRKLLHIMYGVLKNGQPFDPNYLVNVQVTS